MSALSEMSVLSVVSTFSALSGLSGSLRLLGLINCEIWSKLFGGFGMVRYGLVKIQKLN